MSKELRLKIQTDKGKDPWDKTWAYNDLVAAIKKHEGFRVTVKYFKCVKAKLEDCREVNFLRKIKFDIAESLGARRRSG